MKLIRYLLFCTFIFVLPPLAQAEAGWTDYVTIAEVVPTGRHYYEVKLYLKENPSGCRNSIWFYQDYRLRGSEKMFDTVLEGLLSGNKVRVYVTGKCNVSGYSEFTAVGIVP